MFTVDFLRLELCTTTKMTKIGGGFLHAWLLPAQESMGLGTAMIGQKIQTALNANICCYSSLTNFGNFFSTYFKCCKLSCLVL